VSECRGSDLAATDETPETPTHPAHYRQCRGSDLDATVKQIETVALSVPRGLPVARLPRKSPPRMPPRTRTSALTLLGFLVSATLAFGGLAGTGRANRSEDAFGNVVSDTNPALDPYIGFAGGLTDRDTGLIRFGFRDYLPDIGRWTARDPIGIAGGDLDLYAYCGQDPVNRKDPAGLFAFLPAAWILGEMLISAGSAALGVYGAIQTANTLADPCASGGEKAAALYLAAAGMVLPGASTPRSGSAFRRAGPDKLYRIITESTPEANFLSNAAKGLRPRRPEVADPRLYKGVSMFDTLEGAASRVPILEKHGHAVRGIAEVVPGPELTIEKTLGTGHYTVTGSVADTVQSWVVSWTNW